MKPENYLKNLQVPTSKVDVIIDTDTYNEIDDQFAVSYLLAHSEKLNTIALYAAPFFNSRSESPKDGMEQSYEELLRLLTFSNHEELKAVTYKGSETYLLDEKTPVLSDAAKDLVARAMNYSEENPLYVVAIGAITNVASALLLNPEIADKIVVVWLGGNGREMNHDKEFNLYQDVAAARVVFASGAPVVQLPCAGVVSSFTISYVEMEHHMRGANPLCDFLVDRVHEEISTYASGTAVSRVIWDVTAVAWLLNDENRFMSARLAPVLVPEYDNLQAFDHSRLMQYVYHINRDALATDLIKKLTGKDTLN